LSFAPRVQGKSRAGQNNPVVSLGVPQVRLVAGSLIREPGKANDMV